MVDLLIKNGRILNPAENEDFTGDILIRDGMIVEKGKDINNIAKNPI